MTNFFLKTISHVRVAFLLKYLSYRIANRQLKASWILWSSHRMTDLPCIHNDGDITF